MQNSAAPSPLLGSPLQIQRPKQLSRGHIPIRSITFKKSLADPKDVEFRREMSATLSKFDLEPKQQLLSAAYTSPTRASSNCGIRTDLNTPTSPTKPHMLNLTHKLSFYSTKNSTRLPTVIPLSNQNSALLPQIKTNNLVSPKTVISDKFATPKTTNSDKSEKAFIKPGSETLMLAKLGSSLDHMAISNNLSHLRKERLKTSEKALPENDYFKLLFDENRKTFNPEEYQGTDEFYTNDQVMDRIYRQGFSDYNYFGTRKDYTVCVTVPEERTIKEEYRLTIPANVGRMENPKTLASHVLGGGANDCNYIQSKVEGTKDQMVDFTKFMKSAKDEFTALSTKYDQELQDLHDLINSRIGRMEDLLRDDYIANQNGRFKAHKEITGLQRDKLEMDRTISNCVPKLDSVDEKMFGQPIFGLETNDDMLDNISQMNLRSQMASSMNNRVFLH